MGAVTEGVIVEWEGRWEDGGVIQPVVWYMWCGSGRCVHAGFVRLWGSDLEVA